MLLSQFTIIGIGITSKINGAQMFKTHQSQIRTLRANDPRFLINDGLMISPRAGFHILPECPEQYKFVIRDCIQRGWLQPVANVTERELIFMGLTNSK